MRYALLLPLLSVLCVGCVSASRYDDLKQKYDAANRQLADRSARVATLEQEIAEREARARSLEADIEQRKAAIVKLEQQGADSAKLIAAQADEGRRLADELAQLVRDRSKLKESSDELKRALLELSLRKAEADRRVAEYRGMLVRFKNLIDAGTLRVRIVDGRMVLALPSDVLFDSGSAKLSKVGKEAVQQVATVLAGMEGRRFQVEGHTDDVPIRTATFPSNWELAAARALVVVRAMTASGMQSDALSAASYGEYHPAASNETDSGRAENRRIEIVLLPDLSSLPGFDELQRVVAAK